MNEKWDAVVEMLEGTCCYTLEQACEEHEVEETSEFFLKYLDQHIFLCDDCGWWCSIDENYDGRCKDCDEEANSFFCLECHQTYPNDEQQSEGLCTHCDEELNKTYCAICGAETEGVETCDECDNAEYEVIYCVECGEETEGDDTCNSCSQEN